MLSVILILLFSVLLGYPYLLRVWPVAKGASAISLAFLLGGGLLTVQLFVWLFVFKWPANYWLWLWLLSQIPLAWRKQGVRQLIIDYPAKLTSFLNSWRRQSVVVYCLVFLLFVQITVAAASAWLKPVVHYDSLTMWSLKPLLLYERPTEFVDCRSDYCFSKMAAQSNYPWQIPLQVWLQAKLNGRFDVAWLNFIYFGYFLASLALLYGSVIDQGRRKALLFVNFLMLTPLFFYHGWNAYADLPLSVYGLAGLVAWLNYKSGKLKNFWPALLFWGMAFWVKNEGALFLAAGLLVSLIEVIRLRRWTWLKYCIFSIIPLSLWVLWLKLSNLSLAHEPGAMGWHPEVLEALSGALWTSGAWGILWYVAIVYLLLYLPQLLKDGQLRSAWLWWLTVFVGFLAVYLFTPDYRFVLDYSAVQRNLLLLVPSLWLLLSLKIYEIECSDTCIQ